MSPVYTIQNYFLKQDHLPKVIGGNARVVPIKQTHFPQKTKLKKKPKKIGYIYAINLD